MHGYNHLRWDGAAKKPSGLHLQLMAGDVTHGGAFKGPKLDHYQASD